MGMLRRTLARLGSYHPAPGDVVLDRFDRIEKTVESVAGDRVSVEFFDVSGLRRTSLPRRSIAFVR